MKLFKKQKKHPKTVHDILDTPLYKVPGTNNVMTWADSVTGTMITGAIGSGKTSAVGKHIAKAMLKSGYGILVLCAKNDERRNWENLIERYAPERKNDLIVFNKQSGLQFNFLQYELVRKGEGSGDVLNMTNSLMILIEAIRIYKGGGSDKGERFWDLSLEEMINRTITTLKLAGEPITIANMRKLVSSRFVGNEAEHYRKIEQEADDEKIDPEKRKKAQKERERWIRSSYFLQALLKISNGKLSPNQLEDQNLIVDYWLKEFPKIGERANGIIVASFMGIVEPFLNDGILKHQFSKGLSEELMPENIYLQNKIVIVDFNLKEYKISGLYASIIYKSIFQDAMERRDVTSEENPKPTSLWIDEFQNFCTAQKDSLFVTTARSSWVANVFITQNINNINFVMGDKQPEQRAKSLLGNLNLKYFCSNDNYDTNLWASNMIGQHIVDFENLSISHKMEISKSKNQQLQYRILPSFFTTLKTGRRKNNHIVEAVVFKAGTTWGKNKQNSALIEFDQQD